MYKLEFHTPISYAFRSNMQPKRDFAYVKSLISKLRTEKGPRIEVPFRRRIIKIDRKDIVEAELVVDALENSSDEYKIRSEYWDNVHLYSNDKDMLLDLSKKLQKAVKFWEPAAEAIELLKNKHDIAIVNTPPDMEFKIYFSGNKIDPSFAKWLKANTDKSRIGLITLFNIEKEFFMFGKSYYFYVRDEKVLTMVQMLVGHNIHRVEKQIYKGDIDKYNYASE